MTVTFDLYRRKTKLYYIGEIISIITVITLGTCATFNFQPVWPYFVEVFAVILVFVCVFIMLAFVFIGGYGMSKTYIKDGELTLSDDEIEIDGILMKLNNTKKITLKIRPRSRRSGWRMTGNKIEVVDDNDKTYNRLFCINSYECNDQLFQMLNAWDKKGIQYSQDYTMF